MRIFECCGTCEHWDNSVFDDIGKCYDLSCKTNVHITEHDDYCGDYKSKYPEEIEDNQEA